MKNNQPTAKIAVNKNVVKVQRDGGNPNGVSEIVYLNNGQEFQIELFNSTNGVVAAEIFLNDQRAFSSMLVLRPAERVFLDCNPETKRKFKFETYKVSGKGEQVKEAIKNNGKVEVKFYRETIPTVYRTYPNPITTWINYPGTCYYGTSGDPIVDRTFTISSNETAYNCWTSNASFASTNKSGTQQVNSLRSKSLKKEIETGRVEAGSHSNQSFNTANKQFDHWAFHTATVQIIPVSQKPLTTQSFRNYCSECGVRMRQTTWKFCPLCGNKF